MKHNNRNNNSKYIIAEDLPCNNRKQKCFFRKKKLSLVLFNFFPLQLVLLLLLSLLLLFEYRITDLTAAVLLLLFSLCISVAAVSPSHIVFSIVQIHFVRFFRPLIRSFPSCGIVENQKIHVLKCMLQIGRSLYLHVELKFITSLTNELQFIFPFSVFLSLNFLFHFGFSSLYFVCNE